MKKYFILGAILCCTGANAQLINLIGENYILLNGERFKQQKMVFTKASGDWYSTGKDGHGTLEFKTAYEGRPLTVFIEWDGSEGPHLVDDNIRHSGKRMGDFGISMADKNTYADGLNAYPGGEDKINISILKIDDMNVTGNITGMITGGRDKVKVDVGFSLKKNAASKKMANSSYKDCDNVVHDKLIGAEDRSPSECEAKYDLDVRTAIHNAVTASIEHLQKEGWEIETQTDLSPLFEVGRGSEKDIFSTQYELKLQASNTSETYSNNYRKYTEYSEKVKSGSKEDMERFMNFIREMAGAIKMNINFFVNSHSAQFSNFKGGAKITKLSAGLYKIESNTVSSRSGGGEDAEMDATFLLIGDWKQPVIEKQGDGGEVVKASAILKPNASHLEAQNIFIRMECSHALADQFINYLDLKNLQSLLNH